MDFYGVGLVVVAVVASGDGLAIDLSRYSIRP